MKRSLKDLFGYHLSAVDGDIGWVQDFYFDDRDWTVRYMAAETSGWWLGGRKVLISPAAFNGPQDWLHRRFPVSLTRAEVKKSPMIEAGRTLSHEQEEMLAEYYRWPVFWSTLPGEGAGIPVQPEIDQPDLGDYNLHSAREVIRYPLLGRDGREGHIWDYILDDQTWVIRYLVMDTGSALLPGKKILVAPAWIREVDWVEAVVRAGFRWKEVVESPPFDPGVPISQEYEEAIAPHLGSLPPRAWARGWSGYGRGQNPEAPPALGP